MNQPTKRLGIVAVICAGCTLVAMLLYGLIKDQQDNQEKRYILFQQAELYTQDLRMRLGKKTPVDPRLVLIGIDRPVYSAADFSDEAIQKVPVLRELQSNFPWSRVVWAELLERLSAAGAKVVAFDLVFGAAHPDDEIFQKSLERHRAKAVIGCSLSPQKTERGTFVQLLVPSLSILPAATDTESLVQDDRVGYVNIPQDLDGVVRRVPFRQTGAQLDAIVSRDVVLESLAARVLAKFGRDDAIPSGFDSVRFRYGNAPGYGYKVHPIGDVLSPETWERNYQNGEFFRGKIVLVGPTADILHDEHSTPFTERLMRGPEIHLNIIAAALHGEFLRETSRWATLAMIGLSGGLAGLFCFVFRQPLKRLLAVAVLVALYWVIAQMLFSHAGWIIPVAVPLLVLVASTVILFAYDFLLEQLERIKLRHTMGLYFSPRVLEAVLADPGSMKPKRAEVTLLLTDLRNSTPLAEALGPKGMFKLLNRVFEAQTTAIMSEEGNLEHFLGDQFLSYWGAPQPQPDAADRAERAAVKLIRAMEELRASLPADVAGLFGYGVALHSGNVLVGNKGSALRLDYGLVGDTVNEAARIESLTKLYGVRLLVSRDTFAQFSQQGARRLVDRVIVKGKSEPVDLFECENPCVPANYAELCRRYKAAYDEYFFGRFAEAQREFEQLSEAFGDGASAALAERCRHLIVSPPDGWDGIWKMEGK